MKTTEEIMQIVQDLGLAMADSEQYHALRAAEEALAADTAAQDKLAAVEALRADMRARLEGGAAPETLQESLAELRQMNMGLSEYPTVATVNEARMAFQQLNTQVETLLRLHTGQGGDCGGNCAGCSGCG